jgi:hypothetical protein
MDNVKRDDWVVGGLALALGFFLFLLPWFSVTVTIGPVSASATLKATDDPDGWLAIIAALACFLIVIDLAIERLSPQTQIPAIGDSRENTRFILAVIAAVGVGLKFLFHIHFSEFGYGFYINVILTAVLVWVSYQARAGGSIVPAGMSMPSRSAAAPPPSPPPTPPPAPEPGASSEAAGSTPGPSGGSTPPPGS